MQVPLIDGKNGRRCTCHLYTNMYPLLIMRTVEASNVPRSVIRGIRVAVAGAGILEGPGETKDRR